MRKAGWFLELFLDAGTERWWRGPGGEDDISFEGNTYTGLGERWFEPDGMKRTAGLKSEPRKLEFDSSAQTDNSDFIGALLDVKWHRRPVRLRRIAWDYGDTPDDGDVLVDERGRINDLEDVIQKDKQPVLTMEIESGSLTYLERRRVTRSSSSQKAAFPGDKGFDLAVQHAGTKKVWMTKYQSEGEAVFEFPHKEPVPRQLQVGRFVTEGSLAAFFTYDPNFNQKTYLARVRVIADHKIKSVDKVWINGELTIDGAMTHGVRTLYRIAGDNGEDRFWATFYDGRDDQTADARLVATNTEWTSDHRLRGVAYIVFEHRWDSDIAGEFSYRISGEGGFFYDRRKDTTEGGSGSHRWDDPDTWEYTTDSMVAFDHYRSGILVPGTSVIWFGVGEAVDVFPYDHFEEIADHCDDLINLKGGGTQKRYEFNGTLTSDKTHKENFELIAGSMVAEVIDRGGRLALRPPIARTPVITLTDLDRIDGTKTIIRPGGRINDMVNTIDGNFTDPANDYKPNDYPQVQVTDYVDNDYGEIQDTYDQLAEISGERAQRKAKLYIEQSRRIVTLKETYGPEARVIYPGDWYTRQSALRGFSGGKTFLADEVERHVDGSVTVLGIETDPAELVWDENTAQDITSPPAFSGDTLPPLEPPVIDVVAIEKSANGAKYPGFRCDVTLPSELADVVADFTQAEYGIADSGSDPDRGITGPVTQHPFSPRDTVVELPGSFLPDTEYAFRFRSLQGGRRSLWTDWEYVTSTENVDSTGGGSDQLSVSPDSFFFGLATETGSNTSNGVDYTITGGTGPYQVTAAVVEPTTNASIEVSMTTASGTDVESTFTTAVTASATLPDNVSGQVIVTVTDAAGTTIQHQNGFALLWESGA